MTIFIAADHRGFELKNKIIEYLHEENIRIEDLGNYELDPLDDYPIFAGKVAQAVLQNPETHVGIVICGSGVGVSIVANRFTGIRCAVGFCKEQIVHTKQNDHINILALPSDYIDFEKTKELINVFLKTQPKQEEKYYRRIKELDKIASSSQ
ncbi:MAG: RpiB/LacA/LacB family sugar-phosphate isomerase [Patescibacteria group bacterium]